RRNVLNGLQGGLENKGVDRVLIGGFRSNTSLFTMTLQRIVVRAYWPTWDYDCAEQSGICLRDQKIRSHIAIGAEHSWFHKTWRARLTQQAPSPRQQTPALASWSRA